MHPTAPPTSELKSITMVQWMGCIMLQDRRQNMICASILVLPVGIQVLILYVLTKEVP